MIINNYASGLHIYYTIPFVSILQYTPSIYKKKTINKGQASSSGGILEQGIVIGDDSSKCVIASDNLAVGQDVEVEDSDQITLIDLG